MPLDDELISIREAARRVGVAHTTLSRQVKQGSLRSHGGLVRLSEVLEDRAANIDLAKPHRGRKNGVNAAFDEPKIPVDGKLLSFSAAQALKENYLARLRQLEFETKSGRLIDAEAACAQVFKLSRAERDALQSWPAQVSPLLAAEFSIDPVRLVVSLESHVRRFLTERAQFIRGGRLDL
jgi:hypothetical protein